MQADYWDSTIFLGDAGAAITAAEPAEAPDPSRRISRELLLPQGRVGAWAVFLLAMCALVVLQALRVRFA